jgi:hypothetical protein
MLFSFAALGDQNRPAGVANILGFLAMNGICRVRVARKISSKNQGRKIIALDQTEVLAQVANMNAGFCRLHPIPQALILPISCLS